METIPYYVKVIQHTTPKHNSTKLNKKLTPTNTQLSFRTLRTKYNILKYVKQTKIKAEVGFGVSTQVVLNAD